MSFEQLIVVGNGFDLAHNLHTSYKDFANYYINSSEINEFKSLEEEIKSNYSEFPEENNTWYYFEDWIVSVSRYCFEKEFQSGGDEGKVKNAIQKMNDCNDLFHKMSFLLMDYLQNEQTNHPIVKLKNVEEEYLSTNSLTVSFNYTDTVKKYTNSFDYIHGNINDDHYIVFGLANNELPDLVNPPYIRYDKEVLKFILKFIRYLRKKGNKDTDSFQQELDPHLDTLFSGKGVWKFPIVDVSDDKVIYDYTGASKPIIDFSEMYPTAFDNYYQKFIGVEELVIMGHGLQADSLFFHSLNDVISSSLKNITLYKYDGEKKKDIDDKKDKLRYYFGDKNINIKCY